MTTVALWLVILSGVWLIAVGMLALASPKTALRYLAKMASTHFINYLEITLRMLWGLALLAYAESSKFPTIFWVFGLLLVVTSAVLYFIPRSWHAAYAVWWSKKLSPLTVRIAAAFSLAFGLFLIYATA